MTKQPATALPAQTNAPELRRDLLTIVDEHSARRLTIIDALAGKIFRASSAMWQAINRQTSTVHLERVVDAGLARQRSERRTNSLLSRLAAIVCFRVPLWSVDGIARSMAQQTGWLFGPLAICFWMFGFASCCASLAISWGTVQLDLIDSTLSLVDPVHAYGLFVFYVLVKALHELGHAVVCRRLGAPVGDVGLYFFCFMPSPYCDVSQVWRLDSRFRRAAVMLAGVYVEMVLATIATLIWWLIPGGVVHQFAIQAIFMCGISAIVFNINPLMRLDGYFVLSDWLDSTDLKRDAKVAFDCVVTCRIVGRQRRSDDSVRALGLAAYHVAALCYRWLVTFAIVSFLMSVLANWNLRSVGLSFMTMFLLLMLCRAAKSMQRVVFGEGLWSGASWQRRAVVLGFVVGALAGGLCIPIPREILAPGYCDLADAHEVFVTSPAWVDAIEHDFGATVCEGDALVQLRDDAARVQLQSSRTKHTLAKLVSTHSNHRVLHDDGAQQQWRINQANLEMARHQYQALLERQARLTLVSPCDGIIMASRATQHEATSLHERQGEYLSSQHSWCRVGDPARLAVMLQVDAAQRQLLTVGTVVRIVVDCGEVYRTGGKVKSITEMTTESDGPTQFMVHCELPSDRFDAASSVPIGAAAEGWIEVGSERLAIRIQRWIADLYRDET